MDVKHNARIFLPTKMFHGLCGITPQQTASDL